MSQFKRIILITKPTAKQIQDLSLDILDLNCYTRICSSEKTREFLEKLQNYGYRGRIIVVDEIQYAAGNGYISDDVILGGNY